MAKLYGNIASSALMTFDKSFARANGQPLDSTEVYYSLAAAEEYAATAGAYIGQKIVVVENGVVTHYSIEDAAGTLKELGSKPVGDEKSITVAENGTVSLKGVGSLVFEREVDVLDENGEPTGEKKTENVQFQPLMTKDGLVWVEPSKTTVEGLATLIEALTGRVDTAEKAIDALEDKVGAAAKPESTEGAGDGEAATGLFLALDNEIARAEAAEKALGERIDAIDYVDADELAKELEPYAKSADFDAYSTTEEMNTELAKKADKEAYDQTVIDLNALTARVEAFLDNTGAATEAIDTLQELLTYIEEHDDVELTDILADIQALQNKVVLGTYEVDGETKEYATVKAYVEAAIAALSIGDYAKASDLLDLAGRVQTLEGKVDVAKVSEAISAAEGRAAEDATSKANAAKEAAAADAQTKADAARDAAIADAATKYATKEDLKATDDVAKDAQNRVDIVEGKIDEITSVGGEPNVLEKIKVNGVTLEIEKDAEGKSTKSVNIPVPTKFTDITDDSGFDARITAAQTKANEAAAAATAAQGTADSGVSKADAAQAKADANAEAIAALQGVDTTHGNEINALKGKVGDETAGLIHDVAALSATVGGHTTALATLGEKDAAHDEALAGLNSTVGGHSTDIANLKTAVGNVYTKTEADGKFATGTALTEEVNRAKAAEKANADAIAALYTAAKDETPASGILVDEIARVEGLVTTEKNRAEGVEANHEGRIAKMETFWAAVETPDETIDTLAEIVKYIESDESGAAAMAESIAKNAGDITALTGRVKANEDKLAGIDTTVNDAIAAAKPGNAGETAGLAVTNAVENGIEFADGKGTVHSLNVNKLVQTKNTYLVLNGGNAALTWPEEEIEE